MIEIERLSRYRLFREFESVSSANVYVSHCNAQKNPGKADCVKPVKANQRCSSLIPNKQQQKTPKQPKKLGNFRKECKNCGLFSQRRKG